MRAIPGSPELVSASCRQLALDAERLSLRGDGLRGVAAQTAGAWSGAAALAFEAGADVLAEAFRSAGEDLAEVAVAGREFAARLAASQLEMADLAHREQLLAEERSAWQARAALTPALAITPGAGADAAAPAAARLHALTVEEALVDGLIGEVQRRAQGDRDRFAAALAGSRPPTRLSVALGVSPAQADFLHELAGSGREVAADVRALRMVIAAGADMTRLRQALRAGDLGLLMRAEVKALRAYEHFRGPAWARGKPLVDALRARRLSGGEVTAARTVLGAAAGRANLGLTVVEGFTDLVRGDPDHPGWRDVTTRLSGGVGAAGAVALLAGGPATWSIGAAAVTAYGAYTLGTLIYDNRDSIGRAATGVWQRGSQIASSGVQKVHEAWRSATEAAGEHVGHAVHGVEALAGGAKEALSSLGAGLGSWLRPTWGS